MKFTDPETVLSPKGSIKNLRVLQNTGEHGWALSSMLWDGEERLGIRWNGHEENPLGNPQSRGIPTWFIIPEEIAASLRAEFGGNRNRMIEHYANVTRVTLRPLPVRIWQGKLQEPSDDVWIMSIIDATQSHVQITNPRTGHFLDLDASHIRDIVRDTPRDTPTGPKHGILTLNVQIVFEDGNVRIEPVLSLGHRAEKLCVEMSGGYAGFHGRVLQLIRDARAFLTRPDGTIDQWEEEELQYAESAVASNFLRLALGLIEKAETVSRLPPDEYEQGYNYGRRTTPSTHSNRSTDR